MPHSGSPVLGSLRILELDFLFFVLFFCLISFFFSSFGHLTFFDRDDPGSDGRSFRVWCSETGKACWNNPESFESLRGSNQLPDQNPDDGRDIR